MKTFKKVLFSAAVAVCASTSFADVLYWQAKAENDETFTYATLKTYDSATSDKSSATTLAYASATDGNPGTYTAMQQTDVSAYAGSPSTQMFFVELYQYSSGSSSLVREGYKFSYSDLQSSGYIATDTWGVDAARTAAAAGNMASSTPEPTSGMLLLIGGSLLALRRRRRQA